MPMRRVFFALPPAVALQQALARVADEVALAAQGRAPQSDSIHMTLAFIGDVAVARIGELVGLGAAVSAQRFALSLDRVGSFRRARVAWIAPAAVPPALVVLQRAIADALARAGFRTEARPFAPHVTLARHCTRAMATGEHRCAVRWPVTDFALWASAATPQGARYDEIARWPLA
jgi:RNA 2',3'-cyclic 3'-phosphodiesterase